MLADDGRLGLALGKALAAKGALLDHLGPQTDVYPCHEDGKDWCDAQG